MVGRWIRRQIHPRARNKWAHDLVNVEFGLDREIAPIEICPAQVRENETLGEIDQVLLHVMQERRLDLSLEALPGYKQGIHEYNGKRILVRTSPRLIEPKKGEWPIVKQLIDGRLNLEPEGGADQTPFFHGWNKASLESLLAGPGNFRLVNAAFLPVLAIAERAGSSIK